jgi:hypothetical protein
LLTGALYYNTTTQTMKVYDGANWITATAAGTTALLTYKYVATAGQTTFSGAASVGGTLSYTSNNIIVFVNGVSLDSTDYTATNGTSVVLASGAALNDEVVIVAFKSFTVADTYTKGEVDAFAVKLTGNQTVAGTKTFSSPISGSTDTQVSLTGAQTVAGVKTFSSQPVFSAGIDLSSNGQIKFPSAANKSSNLNTLDDYEEGEWTPTYVTDNVGFSSITYNTGFTKGTYTKVGNLVTLTGYIRTEALTKGSASGNLYIGNLPFSNGSTGSDFTKWRTYGPCTGSNFSSGAPDRLYLGNGLASMNMVRISALNAGTSAVATTIADLNTGSGVNVVEFGISYHTED